MSDRRFPGKPVLTVMALAAVAIMLPLCAQAQGTRSKSATLREMTGAHTKVVWIRSSGGIGHPFGPVWEESEATWQLMALDTDDGGRERFLIGEPGTCKRPMITPSGNRVVYAVRKGKKIETWVIDWNGRNNRKLIDAMPVGVAENPDGVEWVYVHEKLDEKDEFTSILRYRIDDIRIREPVWTQTASHDKWELTRDGSHGASRLPSAVGIVELPDGELEPASEGGCTPGMAPDTSLVMHMRATGHPGIYLMNPDGSDRRYIDFSGSAPGTEAVPDPQYWWTAFARYDKRFLTVSGPHPSMGNRQSRGNIWFIEFDDEHRGVKRWLELTDYPEVETHAYAWVASEQTAAPFETIAIRYETQVDRPYVASAPLRVHLTNQGEQAWQASVSVQLPTLKPQANAAGAGAIAELKPGQSETLSFLLVPGTEPVPSARPDLEKGHWTPAEVTVCEVRGNTQRRVDWSRQWVQLGLLCGEAPLTANFRDDRLDGEWLWDFGDGTTRTASHPEHTYEEPGTYSVTARRDGAVYHAQVRVEPALEPKADVVVVESSILRVDFNKRMNADGAQLELASGVKIEHWELAPPEDPKGLTRGEKQQRYDAGAERLRDPGGRHLMVQLAQPLKGEDTLYVRGVSDTSQNARPLTVGEAGLPVRTSTWPADRTGLVYLWEDAFKNNAVYDESTQSVREPHLSPERGPASIDGLGRMNFSGGMIGTGFFAQTNYQMHFGPLAKANAFTFEATIQPENLTQTKREFPARIVNCSAWHDGDWNFMLGQQAEHLLFSIRTTDNFLNMQGQPVQNDLHGRAPVIEITKFKNTDPLHVVISYVPGRLAAYINGEKVLETNEVTGDLKWGYGELVFGGNHNGGRYNWLGSMEGVAFYKRFMEADEANSNYEVYRSKLESRTERP